MGNIYVLPFATAKIMRQNRIPGCVVTDKLLASLEKEKAAPDKGVGARLLRAAKMYAFLKGMGFAGVHIGGHGLPWDHVETIVDQGEDLAAQWPDFVREFDDPQAGGFYYFEKDEKTGLNRETTANRQGRPLDASVPFVYRLSRGVHDILFEPGKNLFGAMQRLCKAVEGRRGERILHKLEHWAKVVLYDCRDCGDCALTDVAYNCPMSQCPKQQRNGACGGSYEGWCEAYPGERQCVYVKAYACLKRSGEEGRLDAARVPPCNWDFYQRSSWVNFYLGRDHSAARFGIARGEKKA